MALRELSGGDVVSLVERFELPRKAVNELKSLSFEDQIAGIDALLASMNMTDAVVEKMGNTTIAKWNQIKEKTAVIFRDMGESANSEIGKALGKFNEFLDGEAFAKLSQMGDSVLGKTFSGLISGVELMVAAFDKVMNSPAVVWMQTTLPSVFNSVKTAVATAFGEGGIGMYFKGFEDYFKSIMEIGREWWQFLTTEGIPGVKQVFTDLWIIVQPILGSMGSALRILGDVVATVFSTIVLPVIKLAWAAFQTLWSIVSPILKLIAISIRMTFAVLEQTWNAVIKPVLGFMGDKFTEAYNIVKPILDGIKSGFDFVNDAASALIDKVEGVASSLSKVKLPSWFNKAASWVGNTLFSGPSMDGSHKTGLSSVPFDGYTAELHKNEAVLTASQADTLRDMGVLKSAGGRPVLDASKLEGKRTSTGRTMQAASVPQGSTVIIKGGINIHGANKTGKELVREIVTELKYTISNGALAGEA